MTDRELMQQALEALESLKTYAETTEPGLNVGVPVISALRARLARPEPDPVAVVSSVWAAGEKGVRVRWLGGCPQIGDRLYTLRETNA